MEKSINIADKKNELPEMLEELSFSYSLVHSAQESLHDLDRTIRELGLLLDNLKEQTESAERITK